MLHSNVVDRSVSRFFGWLGFQVGENPGYFLLFTVMLTGMLLTGFQRGRYNGDPEYLFTPTDGRSKVERQILQSLFPMNESENFDMGRVATLKMFGRALIMAKDGGSVLRPEVLEVIRDFDELARNITVDYDGRDLVYEDICARKRGKCYSNDILDFPNGIPQFENGSYIIKWPLMISGKTFKVNFYGAFLGGVETDPEGYVLTAKVAKIGYQLDRANPRLAKILPKWEEKFLELFEHLSHNVPNLTISYLVSKSLSEEIEKNADTAFPYFSITVVVMITFSVTSCIMFDAVRSKPWLGVLGFISSMMAVGSAFGFMIYLGVMMIGINSVIPFLMIGIGMDDTFVLLAAWRRTDRYASVASRMSVAYRQAGVSITVTSLTNFISFWVGLATPFPAMKVFCSYTAVAVLFTYIYHITFFGACMTLAGRLEARGLHSLTLRPSTPKSLAKERGPWFRLFCTGGINPEDPDNPLDNADHYMMVWFRDKVGGGLESSRVKIAVFVGFAMYLALAGWGVGHLQEGIQFQELTRYDSYAARYFDVEYMHFQRFPFRIQILVNRTLNYADPQVQLDVEAMVERFEANPYIEGSYLTESWLRVFLRFLKDKRTSYFLENYDMNKKEDFIYVLRNVFFRFEPARHFENDVIFNENFTEIIATRYIVQSGPVKEAVAVKGMISQMRAIADSMPYNVSIYHFYFVLLEQLLFIRDITIQAVVVAAVVMMCVIFLFIPNPVCAFWVAFSIVSIEIGVVGYMALWNVTLNITSMVCLIMCIGFSVDYSAHISHAFISSKKESKSERMREALFYVGMPIFQGSVSTMIGVVALSFAPSHMFLGFFKTVFLVIFFAGLHGLIILPVLLSLPYDKVKANLEGIKKRLFQICFAKDNSKNPVTLEKVSPLQVQPNQIAVVDVNTSTQNLSSCVNNGFVEEPL